MPNLQISNIIPVSESLVIFVFGSDFSVFSIPESRVISSTKKNDESLEQYKNIKAPDWDALKSSKEKKSGKHPKGSDSEDFTIRAATVCPNKKYFAFVTENKRLAVYDINAKKERNAKENININNSNSNNTYFTITLNSELSKKGNALCFDNTSEYIVVGDKFGDGVRYKLVPNNEDFQPETIFGHVSILTSVLIQPKPDNTSSNQSSFIVSADRDEKIRVSHYPNSYNIVSFCLGHEEFVSTLKIPTFNRDILFSGSGDGTLRVWNIGNGSCLQVVNIKQQLSILGYKEQEIGVLDICCSNSDSNQPERYPIVVVAIENINRILVFKYNKTGNNSLEFITSYKFGHIDEVPISTAFDFSNKLWISFACNSKYAPQSLMAVLEFNYETLSFDLSSNIESMALDKISTTTVEKFAEPTSMFEWGRKSYARGSSSNDL
ncbi:hypothetical protein BB560_004053 [Smittium megazygosporum]|uniref:Uncharacterized protein n=1 Tax=Smittium megazygosporum TaxID=133381 RepID=A0A2T9ZAA7_9FUNG|nr:hypothetical protein BB560_004053 [Smittium megazygosporum]